MLYDLITLLAPCLLDLFHLLVSVLTGVFFGFLVAARVLSIAVQSAAAALATSTEGSRGMVGKHLLFEFFELVIFVFPVVFYLFLCFASGVFDTL